MNEPSFLVSDVEEGYRALVDNALAAFERSTNLTATCVREMPPPRGDGPMVDAGITVSAGGRRFDFLADVEFNATRRVTLAAAKNLVAPYAESGLLIAPYLSRTLAKVCRQTLGLQFIDAVGNAYLERDGLFVYVTGERPDESTPGIPAPAPGTTAWLRVVFVLLCRPELRSASYRDLATAAGVSLGSVGSIMHALQSRRYLATNMKRGTRVLLEPGNLFREWVTHYPTRLRHKLHPLRLRAERDDWWRDVRLEEFQACWGGEIAADKMTGYLRPMTCTLYVPAGERHRALQQFVSTYRMRADPTGNIEVLDKFWSFPAAQQEHDTAPPILVYSDLMASLDPRNLEVAEMLRLRYLKDDFGANAVDTH